MKEKEIENQILSWLNYQRGILAFKINTVGIYDPLKKIYRKTSSFVMPGCSDILGIAYGKFIAIEVKTPPTYKRFLNRPTPSDLRQHFFLTQIKEQGGYSLVACHLSQVEEFIEKIRSELKS